MLHVFQQIDEYKKSMLISLCVCEQAHKELLDAELDFHKKMSSGEDTTDLRRKLGLLQVEVRETPVCTTFGSIKPYIFILYII